MYRLIFSKIIKHKDQFFFTLLETVLISINFVPKYFHAYTAQKTNYSFLRLSITYHFTYKLQIDARYCPQIKKNMWQYCLSEILLY